MIGPRAVPGLLVAVLAACTAGAPDADGPPGAGAAPDTLRGAVAVVGAEPLTHVVLRVDGRQVRLDGPATDQLRQVHGLVVRADGRIRDDGMTVTGFRVREADGLPAADGTLEVHGDTAVVVTASGDRLRWTPVPSALRPSAGERVWIAGPPGSEPRAWGVIR